jgi:hypothetical protein
VFLLVHGWENDLINMLSLIFLSFF